MLTGMLWAVLSVFDYLVCYDLLDIILFCYSLNLNENSLHVCSLKIGFIEGDRRTLILCSVLNENMLIIIALVLPLHL